MIKIPFINVQSPPQPQRKKEKKTEYRVQNSELGTQNKENIKIETITKSTP
jgi:hypothetical protein